MDCFLADLIFELGEDKIEEELELDIELDERGGVGGKLDVDEHEVLFEYWLEDE